MRFWLVRGYSLWNKKKSVETQRSFLLYCVLISKLQLLMFVLLHLLEL